MRIVVALGGNAILRRADDGTYEQQVVRAREVMTHIATLAGDGHELILTHGNGPVVGNILIRNEAARDIVAPMPLFVDDADSQGGIGFLLQSELGNELRRKGIDRAVTTLVTQVVVDPGDPAFHRPTKPVGPVLSEARAADLARSEGWYFREVEPDAYRRVVASPEPRRIIELSSISALAAESTIVIACGGGGIPVVESETGDLEGAEAVIDKDLASAVLAKEVGADLLAILMESDAIYLGWGTPAARALTRPSCSLLREHISAGEFEEGSMLPKAEALCRFVESTGNEALACRAEELPAALAGATGTRVTPDPAP